MHTTWLQVMRLVRAMDAGRREGKGIEAREADQLLTMLLDFHGQALAKPPLGDGMRSTSSLASRSSSR